MVYTVLPNSGQSLGVTRAPINQNFALIQSVFAINHFGYNPANSGKHDFVQMPVRTTPTILAGEGALYTNTVGSASQLFYKRDVAAADYQLTGPFSAANPGYAFLPGGIVLQWGHSTFAAAVSGTITTPYTGTGNLFTAVACADPNKRQIATTVTGANTFTWQVDSGGGSTTAALNWFAIGAV